MDYKSVGYLNAQKHFLPTVDFKQGLDHSHNKNSQAFVIIEKIRKQQQSNIVNSYKSLSGWCVKFQGDNMNNDTY